MGSEADEGGDVLVGGVHGAVGNAEGASSADSVRAGGGGAVDALE